MLYFVILDGERVVRGVEEEMETAMVVSRIGGCYDAK